MWLRRLECDFLIATMASRSNHTRYRDLGCDIFDVAEVSKIRRVESELFARLIGGTHISVGLTDSELRYRDENWTSDFFRKHRMSIRISASRIAEDRERRLWTAAVRKLLVSNPSAEVWLPLGGPHTDHLLTVDACFAAFAEDPALVSGRVIRVYGESPYMARYPRQMKQSLDTLRSAGVVLEAAPAPIDGALQQKRRLASVYDSQDIEGMRADTEASAHLHGGGAGPAEPLWTIRELPDKVDSSGILSAATTEPALVDNADAWAARNKGTANLRILLLMPTGKWAADLKRLVAAFPLARFEVVVSDPGGCMRGPGCPVRQDGYAHNRKWNAALGLALPGDHLFHEGTSDAVSRRGAQDLAGAAAVQILAWKRHAGNRINEPDA